ncbi:MAG TPA: retropepsin-like aspartic protease [Steroidobacteraceae bacterium]|nr:retropepsin-like aspartic protease [Steroidobacteraceae bacterium]
MTHRASIRFEHGHCGPWIAAALIAAVLILSPQQAPGTIQAVPPIGQPSEPPASAASDAIDQLADVMVEAPEPRYVAPTRRDEIGRIWAPVLINGRGPFRLVLDTGATSTVVTSLVAEALGIPINDSAPVMLFGVTGQAAVPTIHVDTLSVGDLAVDSPLLPIVPDALGGAEGILGSEGLKNKRIFIDFRHDKIAITYSRGERPGRGFYTVPFRLVHGQLIVIDALVGSVHAQAIIDTGGESTIGNLALKDALNDHNLSYHGRVDQIEGATKAIEEGELISAPAITMGPILMRDAGVTFADLFIFKRWKMTGEPAIMIGMDALGTLDTLIIDYKRKELQMRTARASG